MFINATSDGYETSYVYDTETGLYYVFSRYYHPAIGRFASADVLISTGQGILGSNMFAYCRNNPVNRVDISGYADTPIEEEYDDDVEVTPAVPDITGGNTGGNGNGVQVGSPGGGYSYTSPPGGGGVSSSIQVGDITVTFGHGGRHMGDSDISQIESFIANNVVTRPATTGKADFVTISYCERTLHYSYYTRSSSVINVGTYYFERIALDGE